MKNVFKIRVLIKIMNTDLKKIILILFFISPVTNAAHICQNVFLNLDHDFKNLILSFNSLEPIVSNTIYARILRGKTLKDFETLSSDPGREVVMLMDSEGIKETFSLQSQIPPLERIGYPIEYINKLRDEGVKFKVVFIKESPNIRSATWDNLGFFLKEAYSNREVVFKLYEKYMEELKLLSFQELTTQYGQINKETNVTLLTESSTIIEFRSFLYNDLKLNELYTGNGYTLTPEGKIGVKEYFILNDNLANYIRGLNYEILDLNF